MGELIRSKEWSATTLGPNEEWPQSLGTTVSLIWGSEHVQVYDDGYPPLCAGEHPKSLRKDYSKTWAPAWDILRQAFELAGQTSFLKNQPMFLDRNAHSACHDLQAPLRIIVSLPQDGFRVGLRPDSARIRLRWMPLQRIFLHLNWQRR